MTRISRLFFPIVLALSCLLGTCRGFFQESSDEVQLSADSQGDNDDMGVEAVYCFNYSIPWMNQNGVIYVTYLVTSDDWAAHVDSELGFINAVFSPPLLSTLIHATDERVDFSSPFSNERSEILFASGLRRSRYNSQSYLVTDLAHSFDECKVWRIPEKAEQRIVALSPAEIAPVEVPYTVNNLSGQFQCNLLVQSSAGRITEIQQTPIQGWNRTHTGFLEYETSRGRQLVSGECRISELSDQFKKFIEMPERGLLGDHPRHDESGLMFHRGGRHIRTSWKQLDDVVVPENISVTLGTTGSGLLLRSARLLTSKKVAAAEIGVRIQNLRTRTSADLVVPNLASAVGRQFWRTQPTSLDAAKKLSAAELKAQQTSLLSKPLSEGNRLLLLGNRVLLTAATDESENLAEFVSALTEYIDRLGESAGLAGQTTVLFNLLEMLRFWERSDLEQLTVQQFGRLREQYPADEQLKALFFATGATETTDLYTHQLIDSIFQAIRDRSTPEALVRGALVLASLRVRSTCYGLLSNTSDHVIKDLQRRVQMRKRLILAYSGLLDALEKEDSHELQLSAQRLRKLLQIVESENPPISETEDEQDRK
jgi:hypothetical protein